MMRLMEWRLAISFNLIKTMNRLRLNGMKSRRKFWERKLKESINKQDLLELREMNLLKKRKRTKTM